MSFHVSRSLSQPPFSQERVRERCARAREKSIANNGHDCVKKEEVLCVKLPPNITYIVELHVGDDAELAQGVHGWLVLQSNQKFHACC